MKFYAQYKCHLDRNKSEACTVTQTYFCSRKCIKQISTSYVTLRYKTSGGVSCAHIITWWLNYFLTYLLTYLLTPWSRVLLEKLTGLQLVKIFPAFYGTRRFITAFVGARHLSLTWASSIQSIPPHLTSSRSIFMLSTHLRLGLPSGLFPSGFPTKTLYTPLPSPTRATCPAYLILLDFITRLNIQPRKGSLKTLK